MKLVGLLLCLFLGLATLPEDPEQDDGTQAERPSLAHGWPLRAQYGPDVRQRMDIFSMSNAGSCPIVLYVPDIVSRDGEQEYPCQKPFLMRKQGMVYVQLRNGNREGDSFDQRKRHLAEGLLWLGEHAASFGGDARRILTIARGRSALLVHAVLQDKHVRQSLENAAVSVVGSVFLTPKGGTSWFRTVSGSQSLPPALFVGVSDSPSTVQNADQIAERWRASGAESVRWDTEHADEQTLHQNFGFDADPASQQVMAFLLRVLHRVDAAHESGPEDQRLVQYISPAVH